MDRATHLRNEAVRLEKEDPDQAINLLLEAINQYPQTWTVENLALDDLIRIATRHERWDEAIFAAQTAQRLDRFPESYAVTEKATKLRREGEPVKALDLECAHGHGSSRYFANEYAKLNERDKAWKCYNDALGEGLKENTHTTMREMANFLLKENKPNQAAEILIDAIEMAEKFNNTGAPKNLTTDLRKVLKAAGISDSKMRVQLADEITAECKKNGSQHAKRLFRNHLDLS